MGVQTDMATPALARFGSDELKKEFLEPSVLGDKVACLGVSEPGGGSDVAAATTTARRVGDDLVINGQKMWITNAFQADWMCLLANTREGNPHRNKSLICLPMDTPGIHLAKKISLTPCVNIINDTIAYTKERKAFGAPLLDNQYIHFRLAELLTEVEMLRSGLYRATDNHVAGEDVTMLASMCKLKCGRLLREVADTCLQFWGGMGFTNDVLVSRYYRDMRLTSIGGGADEVMLQIICKLMGTLPKPVKQ